VSKTLKVEVILRNRKILVLVGILIWILLRRNVTLEKRTMIILKNNRFVRNYLIAVAIWRRIRNLLNLLPKATAIITIVLS